MKTIKTAQRGDWKADELQEQAQVVPMELEITDKEMQALRLGFIPERIGDRWFAYMEDETLFLHHSWTGFCAYAVTFQPIEGGFTVFELKVANADTYSGNPIAPRAEVVEVLIKHCIIRHNMPLLDFQEANATLWQASGIAV